MYRRIGLLLALCFLMVSVSQKSWCATIIVNTSSANNSGEDAGSGDATHCAFAEAFKSIQNASFESGCVNSVATEPFGNNDEVLFSVTEATLDEYLENTTDPKTVLISKEAVDSSVLYYPVFSSPVTLHFTGNAGIHWNRPVGPDQPVLGLVNIRITGTTTHDDFIYVQGASLIVAGSQFTGLTRRVLHVQNGERVQVVGSHFQGNTWHSLTLDGVGESSIGTNSFVNNNTIDGDGSAISTSGAAGTHTFIIHNTFSGNRSTANGGAIYSAGSDHIVLISNNTIYNNTSSIEGGGIYLNSQYYMTGNIIAHNRAAVTGGLDSDDCYLSGSPSSPDYISYNIFSVATSTTGCRASMGLSNNQVQYTYALPALVAASPFYTYLHPLEVGSTAINQIPEGPLCGSSTIAAIDQRFIPAPSGDGCDIGAYEMYTPSVFTFSSPTATVREGETVTLTVHRAASTDGQAQLNYQATGALMGGVETLHWNNKESADKTITIPVPSDTIAQGDRTFTVSLTADFPRISGLVGSPASVTVTIQDVPVPAGSGGASGTGGDSGSGGSSGLGGDSGAGGSSGTGGDTGTPEGVPASLTAGGGCDLIP